MRLKADLIAERVSDLLFVRFAGLSDLSNLSDLSDLSISGISRMDGRTDGQTDKRKDRPSYRDAWTHLKTKERRTSSYTRQDQSRKLGRDIDVR